MLKAARILIVCAMLVFGMASNGFAKHQKEWINATTGLDSMGNEVITQIYGYYLDIDQEDPVFVACNPDTGEEIGEAYIPGCEVGQRDIIIGYEPKYGEDFEVVKRVDPVTVKMMAPNVFTNIRCSSQGNIASSTATWPGAAKAYLIPGSDPDYWLVVNEVYNPNSWPVKVEIRTRLGTYRDSYVFGDSYNSKRLNVDKEIYLNANEKKCVLINRGLPANCYFLGDDAGSKGRWWSEGYLHACITENLDPELPERLKKNSGYLKVYNYYGGSGLLLGETDLSGGFSIGYGLTCKDSKGSWQFTGTVYYTNNGWVAMPNATTDTAVKAKLENILNANHTDSMLSGGLGNIDGLVVNSISSVGPTLGSGPKMERYDLCGPALMDYTGVNKDIFELNSYSDNYVFSRDGVPVLVYEPFFVEFYRFEPGSSPEEGRLVKELEPGFVVSSTNMRRPYISYEDRAQDFTIEEETVGSGWNRVGYWKIKLNHHVTLTAVNPSDYNIEFSNFALALPSIKSAVSEFESSLSSYYGGYRVGVSLPRYWDRSTTPKLAAFENISLASNQSSVIYDEDVVTEIMIRDYLFVPCEERTDRSGRQDTSDLHIYFQEPAVKEAVNDAIKQINQSGEAAFLYGTVTVKPGDGKVNVVGFNRGNYQYYSRSFGGKYYQTDVGLARRNDDFMKNISYFKNGVALRTIDELWPRLLASGKLSASVMTDNDFWRYCEYKSSGGEWVFGGVLADKYY